MIIMHVRVMLYVSSTSSLQFVKLLNFIDSKNYFDDMTGAMMVMVVMSDKNDQLSVLLHLSIFFQL